MDEERNNAYANFANRAQDNYQRELQAHNDMLDEYRRKLEYAKALQRMSSDYEDDDESPDYMQSLTVPAREYKVILSAYSSKFMLQTWVVRAMKDLSNPSRV